MSSTGHASRLRGSLRVHILVPTALLFAVTLGAIAWGYHYVYTHDIEDNHREIAGHFAGMVAGSLTTAMLAGQAHELPGVLGATSALNEDVANVSVIRPDGTVAFSSAPELVGTKPWADPSRFQDTTMVDAPAGDASGYAVIHPVRNAPPCWQCHESSAKLNGWVDVRLSRASTLAAGHRLGLTLVLGSVVALVLLVGISWALLTRGVMRPLRRLLGAMQRVRSGDLSARTGETVDNELGRAARSFDEAIEALRRAQAENEAFVRDRTVRADRFAAVGELASALAHEMKNPLAGLAGALELLAEDLKGSSRHSELCLEMRREVMRVAKTLEALLGFVRRPEPNMTGCRVDEVVERTLFLMGKERGNGVEIRSELHPGLPEVVGDSALLQQVVLNLCLNGVQAMGRRGVLTVRTLLDEGRPTVEVADNGPGIPEEVRPNLFRPFFTTKTGGTGLGLAVAARIVAEHGGHIDYRCPPEGGTVFRVTLPPAPSGAGS